MKHKEKETLLIIDQIYLLLGSVDSQDQLGIDNTTIMLSIGRHTFHGTIIVLNMQHY